MGIVIDLMILTLLAYLAWIMTKIKFNWQTYPSDSPRHINPSEGPDRPENPYQKKHEQQPAVSHPVIPQHEDDFDVIVIHDKIDSPLSDKTQLSRSSQSILQSGEIVIEGDGDLFGLLPKGELGVDEESLILADDIGLGQMGLPLASRLIEAGFDVSSTPQTWGHKVQRSVPLHILED